MEKKKKKDYKFKKGKPLKEADKKQLNEYINKHVNGIQFK